MLVMFGRHMSIRVASLTEPTGEDVYGYRLGTLSEPSGSTHIGRVTPFAIADVDPEVVRSVSRRVSAEAGATIQSVSLRRLVDRDLEVDVNVVGFYGSRTRTFDARSGEEIVKR